MKNHTKIYMSYFGYIGDEFIPCEICAKKAVDIHHIINRKSGGDPNGDKDKIDNLMALCRQCHIDYGDVPDFIKHLQAIHKSRISITNL